jgi:hypothetical protein
VELNLNEQHQENIYNSVRSRVELCSNETNANEPHPREHSDPMTLANHGMMIVSSDRPKRNASNSLRVTFGSDSNEINGSDLRLQKHFDRTIASFRGIPISTLNDKTKRQVIQSVSAANPIQRKGK